MTVELRPAVPDQFPAILSFWRLATEVPSSTDDVEALTTLWEMDPDALIVAMEDGNLIGTLIASWDGWRGSFHRVAVLPSHRGRGVGRMLVAEGEERLRAQGCRRVSLFAVAEHAVAVGFWRGIGYPRSEREIRFAANLPWNP
jgi:ribosomal protein S18 acetylase RimI-like enzyme